MTNERDCVHGQLARTCELCDREKTIHELTAENVSLRATMEAMQHVVNCASIFEQAMDSDENDAMDELFELCEAVEAYRKTLHTPLKRDEP